MKKIALFLFPITAILLIFLVFKNNSQLVLAQTSVGLTDFVAGANFVSHTLSTGEVVSFTDDGGPINGGDPVRMYKNSNYEQFAIGSGGIYRREDTSWAPLSGFQDAYCEDGTTKAVYTLDPGCNQYQRGDQVTSDSTYWAPGSASVGDSWSSDTFQVVTIRSDTDSGRTYCELSNLDGYAYPQACNQSQQLEFQEFYPPGQFTFCTGITNEEDLIKIVVAGGPGTGDTFYFMRGWGLVGFEAPGFESGLMGDGADPSGCTGGGATQQPIATRHPIDEGFGVLAYPCDAAPADPEFHPLRPYPGSPCDPLIPKSIPEAPQTELKKYITYSCGTNMAPIVREAFDPYGFNEQYKLDIPDGAGNVYILNTCDYPGGATTRDPSRNEQISLDCYRTVAIDLTVDLGNLNLGILGNTQSDGGLDDAQKVNNYLSYYFTGTPQIADQKIIDPLIPEDIDRLINYSGPVRKLLPWTMQNAQARSTVASSVGEDVHDYLVGCKAEINTNYVVDVITESIKTILAERQIAWSPFQLGRLAANLYSIISNPDDAAQCISLIDTVLNIAESRDIAPGEITSILSGSAACAKISSDLINIPDYIAFIRQVRTLLNTLSLDRAVDCEESGDTIRLDEFQGRYPNGNQPPIPEDYDEFAEYYRTYLAWRGLTYIPFVGAVNLPINLFANQSVWAQIFQNIPLTSVEDAAGEYLFSIFPPGQTEANMQAEDVVPEQFDEESGKFTAPTQIIIESAIPAGQ